MDFSKLTRYERIRFLQDYGINTVDYILLKKGKHCLNSLEFLREMSRISFRCQSATAGLDFGLPKMIDLMYEQAVNNIIIHLKAYDVLVAKAISVSAVVYTGNIAFIDGAIIVEIAAGSYTNDKVTREGHIDLRWETTRNQFYRDIDVVVIRDVVKELVFFPFDNVVIECSIFNQLVGIKKRNYISWEVTNWKPF